MKNQTVSKKIGIIKTYIKRKEQYIQKGKEDDAALLADKERLDLHLAVIDLVATCAKNSPYCIS